MFGPIYEAITGKDYGTKKRVDPYERLAIAGEHVAGILGFSLGGGFAPRKTSKFTDFESATGKPLGATAKAGTTGAIESTLEKAASSSAKVDLTVGQIDAWVASLKEKIFVMGNKGDTNVARNWINHFIFDIANYTVEKQAALMKALVKYRVKIYLASPSEPHNLFDFALKTPRVFLDELVELAPFVERVGNYLLPKKKGQ